MSLLTGEASSHETGGTPQVQDAPALEKVQVDKTVPDDIRIRSLQAQVDFHEQEIREAPQRGEHGMSPEQVDLHEWQLQIHLANLASFGTVEVEVSAVVPEPAVAERIVPVVPAYEFAVPELAIAV